MEPHNTLDLSRFHELLQAVADAVAGREDPPFREDCATAEVTTAAHKTDHKRHFVAFRLTTTDNFGISRRAELIGNYNVNGGIQVIVVSIILRICMR